MTNPINLHPQDKIIVIDTFDPIEPHGEWVSEVAAAQSIYATSDEIGKIDIPRASAGEADFIGQFTTALKEIQSSSTTARVINISNSRSAARAVGELAPNLLKMEGSLATLREQLTDPDAARIMAEADWLIGSLQLDPAASREDILRAVVDKAAQSFTTPEVQAEQKNLADSITALHDKGISVVISAGNNQQVANRLDDLGIEVDHNTFCRNSLAQGSAIIVGASDRSVEDFYAAGNGFAPTAAAFSNAGGDIAIAADGTDIPITNSPEARTASGTSFAAPAVSALLADLYTANPALTPDAAVQILKDTAIAGADDPQGQLGAGLIFPAQARVRAQDWRFD